MNRDFPKSKVEMASKDVKVCDVTSCQSGTNGIHLEILSYPVKTVIIMNMDNSEYLRGNREHKTFVCCWKKC